MSAPSLLPHTPPDSYSLRFKSLSQPAPQSPLSMLFEGILADTPCEAESDPPTPSSISEGGYTRLYSATPSLYSLPPSPPQHASEVVSEFTNRGEEGGWEDSLLFASCFATLPPPVDSARRGFSSVYTPSSIYTPRTPRPTSPNLDGGTEKLPPATAPDEKLAPKRPPRPPRRCLPALHAEAMGARHVEGLVGERGGLSLRSRRKSPREYLAPILAAKPNTPAQHTKVSADEAGGVGTTTHGSVSTATPGKKLNERSALNDLARVKPKSAAHYTRSALEKVAGMVSRTSEVSTSTYVSAVSQLDGEAMEVLDDARDNQARYSKHHPPQPVTDGYEGRKRKPSLLRKLSLTLRSSSKGRGGTDYSKLPTEAMFGVTPYPLAEACLPLVHICRSPTLAAATTSTRTPMRSRSLSQPTTTMALVRGRKLSLSRTHPPPVASRAVSSVVSVNISTFTSSQVEGGGEAGRGGLKRSLSRRTFLKSTRQVASVHSDTA